MPDPIDLNNPPATPPTLPDPQDVVDAALATEPTVTTPSPVPELATVPETATVSEVPESVAPTPPPTPDPIPTPAPATVPMGDEMPLAFVTSPPTTTTTTTTSTTQPVDDAAPLPPVPPVVPMAAEQPKRKSSGLKNVLGVVVGVFLLVMAVGFGGYYTYLNFGGAEIPTISYITKFTRNSEGKTILNPDYVKQDPINKAINEKEREKDLGINQPVSQVPAEKAGCGSAGCCGDGYEYCGGGINKCVSFDALSASGGGCNKYGEVNYGIATVYGANYSKPDAQGNCAVKKCNCGSTPVCFDKTGYCDQSDTNNMGGVTGTNYNEIGLCALAGTYSSNSAGATFTPKDSTLTSTGYKCTDSNCSTTDSKCTTLRYTCSGTVGGNSCSNTSSAFLSQTQPATSTGFSGKCGTVEQLDVMCGGVYVTSRTRINPDCTENEVDQSETAGTTATTPTMACTGLTRVPTTTPTVGQAVTFSCAGSVTPSTAGTLSYKYRYSLNSGSYLPMTSNVLTIAACGSYSVQCQACATLNGVLTCDPIWTGATP